MYHIQLQKKMLGTITPEIKQEIEPLNKIHFKRVLIFISSEVLERTFQIKN